MKIISKYRDYYDSAFGFDSDDSRIWKRAEFLSHYDTRIHGQIPAGIRDVLKEPKMKDGRRLLPSEIVIGAVCIAGVAHRTLVRIASRDPIESSLDDIREVSDSDLVNYLEGESSHAWNRNEFYRKQELKAVPLRVEQIRAHLAAPEVTNLDWPHLLTQSPVVLLFKLGWFSIDHLGIIPNPPSTRWGRKPAASKLYQDIETYLGCALAAPDLAPLSVGGDRILAQQKGFDDQSFRTAAPGMKKLNRKANRDRKRTKQAF